MSEQAGSISTLSKSKSTKSHPRRTMDPFKTTYINFC